MTEPLYRIAPQDHPATREGLSPPIPGEQIAKLVEKGNYPTDWLRLARLMATGRPALMRVAMRPGTADDPAPPVQWVYILRDEEDPPGRTFSKLEAKYGDLAAVTTQIESSRS